MHADDSSIAPRVTRARRIAVFPAVLVAGGATVLALAWHDVLPGGWRLRGWVRPHWQREAAERAAHRAARLAEFAREAAPRDAVVFLGSSTIERFPLEESFPGVTCLDRGIGDESLAELIARIAETLPPEPRALVVYAGSVDVRRLGRPAEDVAREAAALLALLAARAPGVPVAWIGVLPDRTGEPGTAARVAALNEALAALVAARGGTFVATHRTPLTDPEGRLAPEQSVDDLHLSDRGYATLSRWLRGAFPALSGR